MKERVFKLTDDQHDRLWEDRRSVAMIGEVMGSAIMKVAEEAAHKEEMYWEGLRQLVGASKCQHLQVNWAKRQVTIKDKEVKNGN
jgi:hypothetical protein